MLTASSPPPPSFSGMLAAWSPAWIARERMWAASSAVTSLARSTSSSCGKSSRVTNARTVSTMARCSSSSPKSMSAPRVLVSSCCLVSAPDAYRAADDVGPWQHAVRPLDRSDPFVHVVREIRGATRRHVDVHEQLLGARQQVAGLAVAHLVEDVEPAPVVV